MTKEQNNYFRMLNTIINLFDKNPDIETNNPILAMQVAELRKIRDEMTQAAIKQKNSASKGHTEAKDDSRSMLEERIYTAGIRLRSYASIHENRVMGAPLKFSRSSLSRLKTRDLLILGRQIVEIATPCLKDLEPFRINLELINDLSNNITQVQELFTERDTIVDEGMEAREHLRNLFTEIRKKLKLLDDLTESFIDDSEFITTYHNSRRIHDVR